MGRQKRFVPPQCPCGKKRHRNRDQAAASILRRLSKDAPALMIYPCPSGYGFHISSSVGNIRGRKIS